MVCSIAVALPLGGCATTPAGAGDGSSDPASEVAASEDVQQLLQQLDLYDGANGAPPSVASTDHRIGSQDLLEIVVFDAPELSRTVRVSSQGEIALPLIGVVPAAGATPEELARTLEERLVERYMRDPHVAVQISETRPRSAYVLGEVNRPGSFEFNGRDRTTVLHALAMGGGPSEMAARDRAVLIRLGTNGERTHIPVDLDEALNGSRTDEQILPNDILYVPRSTRRSVVRGVLNTITRIITFRAIF